jgi:hypothetical protein
LLKEKGKEKEKEKEKEKSKEREKHTKSKATSQSQSQSQSQIQSQSHPAKTPRSASTPRMLPSPRSGSKKAGQKSSAPSSPSKHDPMTIKKFRSTDSTPVTNLSPLPSSSLLNLNIPTKYSPQKTGEKRGRERRHEVGEEQRDKDEASIPSLDMVRVNKRNSYRFKRSSGSDILVCHCLLSENMLENAWFDFVFG